MNAAAPIITVGDLTVFKFDSYWVRILDRDGSPWWVLSDVCEVLGIGNSRDVAARLQDTEKGVDLIDTPGGKQSATIVNESGLYKTIFRSDKPEARRFETWVTSEVLPSIRRTGSYTVPQGAQLLALAVLEAQRVLAERDAELAAARPKIESFDALMASERTMSITDAAKHFGLHPKTEVFPYLRALGYLTQTNLPTQAAIDAGYLSLKEVKAQDGKVYPQAVVEAWQLENWRAHVVHQIKRFNGAKVGA